MKTKRKIPAVINAPLDAGDNIPNIAKTGEQICLTIKMHIKHIHSFPTNLDNQTLHVDTLDIHNF